MWRPCTGNEVSSLEGLGPLPSLRRLEVTGNKLTSTAGLAHLPAAHELLLVSGPRVDGEPVHHSMRACCLLFVVVCCLLLFVVVWGPFRKAGRCCCG
jgi:hypothetical protein